MSYKQELQSVHRHLETEFEDLRRIRDENPMPIDDSNMTEREISFQANLQMAHLTAEEAARYTKNAIAEVLA